MDDGRAGQEATGIQDGFGGLGYLAAMGVAVKNGEEAHKGDGGGYGDRPLRGNGHAQGDERQGDAGLHQGEASDEQAQQAAHGHDADESGRDGPDGPAANLGAHDAHAQHSQQMINA